MERAQFDGNQGASSSGGRAQRRAVLVRVVEASAWTQADLVSKKPFVAGMPC